MLQKTQFILKPDYIISDFEKAAINASQNEFRSNNKCCFFHLSQSIWRKVQGLRLATLYGTDQDFSIMVRHIPALAFLPDSEIPDAFNALKNVMPEKAKDLMSWFEENYVLGKVRRRFRDGSVNRSNPIYPPKLWSIYENNSMCTMIIRMFIL